MTPLTFASLYMAGVLACLAIVMAVQWCRKRRTR